MANNIDQILSWTSLTDTVMLTKPGIPNPMPEKLFTTTVDIPGDKAQYINLYGTRQVAKRRPFTGGPNVQQPKAPLSQTSVRLFSIGTQQVFDQELTQQLREFAEYTPQFKYAVSLIEYQGEQFRQTFENTRIACVGMSLSQGKVWWDANNNLLTSATNAVNTFDQGIPTANTGTVTDVNSPGGIVVSSPWSLRTTDLITQINTIKKLSEQRGGGYPIKYALYGQNIAGYISQNDLVNSLFPFDTEQRHALTKEGRIPNGFLGLEWIPVQNAFWQAPSEDGTTGAYNEIFRQDYVTFMPEISRQTYAMFQGTTLVPKSWNIAGSAMDVMKNWETVTGMGRYAYPDMVGGFPQIIDVGFDTFAPKLQVPNAFFIVNTCP